LIPITAGPIGRGPRKNLLLDGSAEMPAGRCETPIKVNLGDVGYYRTEYGPKDLASLSKALNAMAPDDRLNFLDDSWALVQAGRAEPSSYLALLGRLATNDQRAVWDQAIGALTRLDRLARDRTERPALQAFARAILRPVFDRLGWDASGSADDDDALLRASLIRTLGEFGDADVIAEAKRRFDRFLQDPNSLPVALRAPVAHVVGITADRHAYDTLLSLARNATSTEERVRYYYAAASAHDPVLARDTLKLTLTNELPTVIALGLINTVASSGEQPELAWHFVQKHYDALFARLGPSFRDEFIPNLMTNFTDGAYAAELLQFAPAQATSGGKVMTARAVEAIAISADLKTRALPAVDAWIKEQASARP
jgi:aminopeptidase N